ncbi:MAG: metal ABC transporter permease [Pirellulales bacterium]
MTTVDPLHGRTIGLSTERVRYLLLVLLALAIVAGIQAVGVVLTTALLITPAATASLCTRRLPSMLAFSAGFAAACVVAGLYASYYLDVSAGGAIVVTCSIAFGLVYASRSITSIAARLE